MPVENFTSMSDLTSYLNTMEQKIVQVESDNAFLQEKIALVESDNKSLREKVSILESPQVIPPPDVKRLLPKTNLLSRKYLTRAFAVWGHQFVAQLILSAIFLLLYILVIVILLVSGVNLNFAPPANWWQQIF